MIKRLGHELSRTNMANWVIRLDEVFRPLIHLMREVQNSGNYLQADGYSGYGNVSKVMKCLLTRKLALNDIESYVKNEQTVPVGVQHGIGKPFHELWILNDHDYIAATDLIAREVENPSPKAAWVCGECNEENDGSFDVCWKCQSAPIDTQVTQGI